MVLRTPFSPQEASPGPLSTRAWATEQAWEPPLQLSITEQVPERLAPKLPSLRWKDPREQGWEGEMRQGLGQGPGPRPCCLVTARVRD